MVYGNDSAKARSLLDLYVLHSVLARQLPFALKVNAAWFCIQINGF